MTSLTLSWQRGIQNVSGGVVYLLKKKAISRDYTDTNEYMVSEKMNADNVPSTSFLVTNKMKLEVLKRELLFSHSKYYFSPQNFKKTIH